MKLFLCALEDGSHEGIYSAQTVKEAKKAFFKGCDAQFISEHFEGFTALELTPQDLFTRVQQQAEHWQGAIIVPHEF